MGVSSSKTRKRARVDSTQVGILALEHVQNISTPSEYDQWNNLILSDNALVWTDRERVHLKDRQYGNIHSFHLHQRNGYYHSGDEVYFHMVQGLLQRQSLFEKQVFRLIFRLAKLCIVY